MNRFLFLFPGQGAQYPGIGSDLTAEYSVCRDVYERASDALGYNMADLSNDAESGRIDLTKYTQPVLLTHSYACLSVFLDSIASPAAPSFACGHSLGEYSALLAAGALDFEAAVKLVSARGQCMADCGGGDMLALTMSKEQVAPLLAPTGCEISACNLPRQTVVGGWPKNIDHLLSELESFNPKPRGIRLKTEGAFHTSHMRPAAEKFKKVLDSTHFELPACPVSSNARGRFHETNVEMIRTNLYRQLFQPVQWHSNLMQIAEEGVDVVIEFGGGLGADSKPSSKRPNLAGMIMQSYRRLKPRPKYFSVINIDTLLSSCEQVSKL